MNDGEEDTTGTTLCKLLGLVVLSTPHREEQKGPAAFESRSLCLPWTHGPRSWGRNRVGHAEHTMTGNDDDAMFRDALQGLRNGDFSKLEPLFTAESGNGKDFGMASRAALSR
jgi:hypothetical protein